jgi:predicted TIM-barrel fold metal-dependent hydrolase
VVLERRPLPPESTFDPKPPPSLIPQANPVSVELRVTEETGPFYYFHQVRHDIPIRELVWLPKREFHQFQAYPKQTEHTLAAAAATPWSMLPLYHYDPRRWSQASGKPTKTETFDGKIWDVFPQAWDEPFKQYFQKGSMRFAGIKLYTALGYRPWEPGGANSRLPRQKDFYDQCTKDDLPIVCHCSPGGMYSFDRPFFAKADAKRRGVPVKALRKETEDLMKARGVEVDWEEYWFSEHYVSPRAWREVLKKPEYKKLRLSLAHFGGDLPEFSNWTRKAGPSSDGWDEELFRMTGEFENVYVDISYFIFDDRKAARLRQALADHPHLRDKILFGTDWWMIEMSGLDYKKYVEQARQALDGIDPELWQRFSWINPVRFYRLKENAEALAEGLRAGGPSDPEAAKEHKKAVRRGLAVLQALEPRGDRVK